jgi:hypothetical protein
MPDTADALQGQFVMRFAENAKRKSPRPKTHYPPEIRKTFSLIHDLPFHDRVFHLFDLPPSPKIQEK